ncbi:prepilin-type N-terminal cleavage/methylation domain-containing protein [Argonema antarcticum]|uniref:prepilin-type N-terminal cleavage/methylation domain-containing protein n=1 Tax=Argonema antarcticum TaxID=2942763 RepID=UPI002012F065|nr:prepilin-type N-terminal cleavage/methylation domain-containing protein [Argonema antarcticum]MCL1471496.1 prepilin-type N-terminal cleavage/methylation domain-containing protein [Argonema antarcticum A004/B2]
MLPANQLQERSNGKLLKLVLLAKLLKGRSSQSGFSLLEVLVAIAVAAVVISVFTPPIFLAVGTRIQNRRAEQSIQLAQGEIDRVRRLVEQGAYLESSSPYNPNSLPPSIGTGDVKAFGPPTTYTDEPTQINASKGLRVDANGDGTKDFLVQVFRDTGVVRPVNGVPRTFAFNMGVRIYADAATQNIGQLAVPNKAASLGLTTAIGSQKRLPLSMLYTTVVRSDVDHSLCDYHQFNNGGARPAWCPIAP